MRPQRDLLAALFGNIKAQKARAQKKGNDADKVQAIRGFMRNYQKALDDDLSPLISVLSARQQGKSTGALLLATKRCVEHPGAQWVIIGLTRASVERIYWDALRNLSESFELGIKFQQQRLIVTFPNNSKIHFFGADKIDEIEKLRGGRYHGAIVDECKSYPETTLRILVEDVLGAALKGQAGQLYLIGTPGDVLAGEFFLATTESPVLLEKQRRWSNLPAGETSRHGEVKGLSQPMGGVWSFHAWGPQTNDVVFTNERTGERFRMWDAFSREKELRGWDDTNPTWRREYLGQWVPGDGKLVYRYRSHIHDFDPDPATLWGLPALPQGAPQWRTCIGLDFGTRDGTAMVVWAWHENRRDLWELYSEKRRSEGTQRLSVSDIARWFKQVEAEYGPFDGAVGDPAGLSTMVMDTLATEHQVYIEPAEKKEKLDHIELFNDDLDAGLIHFVRGSLLTEEALGNKWQEKSLGTPKRIEDPSTPNDALDAGLYAFRWANHRRARPPTPFGPAFQSLEWYRARAAEDRAAAEAKARKPRDGELDSEWWS